MSYAAQAEFKRVERDANAMAIDLLDRRGIPTDTDSALELGAEVWRYTSAARRGMATTQENLLRAEPGALHIARPRRYPMTASIKLIHRCAGLMPGQPLATEARYYDPETRRMTRARVSPWAMPELPETREAFRARIAAGVARHVKQVARDMVIDTATKTRMRKGQKVGWARTLSGSENCAFCAMLASRGAVYTKDTVKFRSHDHCDCSATIVHAGQDWDGAQDAARLGKLWQDSGGMRDFAKKLEEMSNEQ